MKRRQNARRVLRRNSPKPKKRNWWNRARILLQKKNPRNNNRNQRSSLYAWSRRLEEMILVHAAAGKNTRTVTARDSKIKIPRNIELFRAYPYHSRYFHYT